MCFVDDKVVVLVMMSCSKRRTNIYYRCGRFSKSKSNGVKGAENNLSRISDISTVFETHVIKRDDLFLVSSFFSRWCKKNEWSDVC